MTFLPALLSLILPLLLVAGFGALNLHHAAVAAWLGTGIEAQTLRLISGVAGYFAAAWLATRLIGVLLDRARPRKRRVPKLLRDLIGAALFMTAFFASVMLLLGQNLMGALASSGLVLAMLGFAVRNVVADTLSGVALGLEAPFRSGDWVSIDGVATGRVIEIGWRTTRILTRNSTYMILPNSQIARQRMINYSAPRSEYRAQIDITLDHDLPVAEARELLIRALGKARLIQKDPAPDIRITGHGAEGIGYTIRYWVAKFDRDVDCRDEIFSLIDAELRAQNIAAPRQRVQLWPVPAAGVGTG